VADSLCAETTICSGHRRTWRFSEPEREGPRCRFDTDLKDRLRMVRMGGHNLKESAFSTSQALSATLVLSSSVRSARQLVLECTREAPCEALCQMIAIAEQY